MKIALIVVFVLVAALLVVMLVGLMLPKAHRASRAARFSASPETIWAVLIDYSKYPTWRTNLKSVEALPAVNGMAAWREIGMRGQAIPFVIVESDAPRRMKTKINDSGLPFGGTWTFEVTPTGDGGSVVRITEDGEVYNPVFRFVSRYFMGYTATIDSYLKALGAKFGETPTLEN